MIIRMWISPFFGENIVVTLDFHKDKTSIDVKRYQIRSYESGEVIVTLNKSLISVTYKKYSKIDKAKNNSFFIDLVFSDFLNTKPKAGHSGADGWTWEIEANIYGKYVFAKDWVPSEGSIFELGNAIIEFSGIRSLCQKEHGCRGI